MNLWKRFTSLFGGQPGASGGRTLTVYVLSRRCNEPIAAQVDLLNELSSTDEGDYAFYTRKLLRTSGERRCFDQIEVELYFDANKQLAHHEVQGGRWLEEVEYEAELVRFRTPPSEDELIG
jgi:hypothetical protein